MSPPFVVTSEKLFDPCVRAPQRLGPLVEQLQPALGDRIGALSAVPGRGDELLLLERAQQAVEVAHLDAPLAGELRQALEQVVAVGRPLAEEQEQGRFGETLDPGEDVPAPAGVAPGARPASHPTTCKTHM